jgi:uncharacterized protein YkwD
MTFDRRALLTGLAATTLAGPVLAAPPERWLAYERRLQDRAGDAGGGRFDAEFEQALLGLTLSFRSEQRVDSLADDPELARAARAHAADMAARDFFGHETPEGFSPIDRSGLLVRRMMGVFGENLADHIGAAAKATPRICFQGWQDSPGHRANLLRVDYTHVGHGVARLKDRVYMAAVFGGRAASLDVGLPLHADGPQINAALIAAHPPLPAYFVSDPLTEPTGDAYPTPGLGPHLPPGAWRLRPLKPKGGRASSVLWGPIVVV